MAYVYVFLDNNCFPGRTMWLALELWAMLSPRQQKCDWLLESGLGISRFLVSKSKELKIGVTQICKGNKIALFRDSGNTNQRGTHCQGYQWAMWVGIFKSFNNRLGLPLMVFKRKRSLKYSMGNSLFLMDRLYHVIFLLCMSFPIMHLILFIGMYNYASHIAKPL